MRLSAVAILLAAGVAGGCTWVRMDPAATSVSVARAGQDLGACQRLGEIGVSVRDRVGFYDRSAIKVREELETLARNEAVGLGADTMQPLGEPVNGEQRFAAFRCRSG